MTMRLPRLGTLVVLGSLLGACSQLIGLNDFDKTEGGGGEHDGSGGDGAKGGSSRGGTAGSGGSGGTTAGTATQGGGSGGSLAGRSGSGGVAGSGTGGTDTAGEGGEAPTNPRGGTGGTGTGGTTGGTSTMAGMGGEPSYDCVSVTEITTGVLLPRDTSSSIYPANNSFTIEPQIGNAADDELWIDFYSDSEYDGERTGTFDLSMPPDDNYATCARCVWFGQDVGAVSNPRAYFYVRSGTLTIDPASLQVDGFPMLTLDDVTLVESTIDVADTNVSEPVPNPRCLHLAHASIDMPAPPSEWTCDPTYYGTNDGCDCGCGVLDPDCASAYSGACDTCADDGGCGTDADYCVGIDPDNNAVCNTTPVWLCSPLVYGDGQSCDCGCGVVDADCSGPEASACDSCAEAESCDSGGDCMQIDPANNGVCLP